MSDHTHSFTFDAGVLKIFDNATGAQVVEQPHNPNTGLGWTSEAEAMAYGQIEFHHMYQKEIPKPVEIIQEDTISISTSTTVGTGE
jgi:hypothetical protein